MARAPEEIRAVYAASLTAAQAEFVTIVTDLGYTPAQVEDMRDAFRAGFAKGADFALDQTLAVIINKVQP